MKSIVSYFINRPVIANLFMFGLILSGIVLWEKIGKEELPDFAMNSIRVSIRYPGASAEDVELSITKPAEEKLKGITGLKDVISTSSYGTGSFRISFEPKLPDIQEKIQEVKDAIDAVSFPKEADDPVYRRFKTSEHAIIDIGIYLKNKNALDVDARIKLQKYALAFKNKLISLKEISGIDTQGYRRPELQIKVLPWKLKKYEISMGQIRSQIVQQHVRRPIGSMKDKSESEITLISELDDIESIKNVIVTSGFQGQQVKLSSIAKVENGFEKSNYILKIQGSEGVILRVKKSTNVDIISGQKAIINFLNTYKKNDPDSPVDFVLIDDESYDVRNRLSLISNNGILGFILIVIVLFIFLDFKSGIWVAMGIPFSLAFTLLIAFAMGYTVNNMTLAAIIIVLGIVVDDAIIIAENISRKKDFENTNTSTKGTLEVIGPIIASILTTCAAFVPLYFFSGRFGLFVKYIPTIVFLMLTASFLESLFILPSHMAHPLPFKRFFARFENENRRRQIRHKIENFYSKTMIKILPFRIAILTGFIIILVLGGYLFSNKMKYVMFPREELRSFRVKVVAKEDLNRHEMAKLVNQVEKIFLNDSDKVVTSVRTRIGQSRRGGEVRENEASMRVEILPPSEREISLSRLMKRWKKLVGGLKDFAQVRFLKSRFGSESGSPIVIEIQENNEYLKNEIAQRLKNELEVLPGLINVEIEEPKKKNEYILEVKKDEVSGLGIDYEQLSSTLRAYVEGEILYTLISGEEEVDVRFTSEDNGKDDIEKLLNLTVANKENYLVPIKGLVSVRKARKAGSIEHVNYKRTVTVYADFAPHKKMTPLAFAEKVEAEIFPRLLAGNPTTALNFRGEVEDSRESKSDFLISIIMALAIMYILLVFLFDSMSTPLLIGAIIPFGVIGVIYAFLIHGMVNYGFFAVVGTLGMMGVVVNDSIVLVNKLEKEFDNFVNNKSGIFVHVANVTSTRLRAVVVTTFTTTAGLFPTAYGISGYDSMLAEMMLAMGWGLLFGMFITLVLLPCLYSFHLQFKLWRRGV